jgi:hypothetical protein
MNEYFTSSMTGQISEDGNWVWNGYEWVPIPPQKDVVVQPQQAISTATNPIQLMKIPEIGNSPQQLFSPQPVDEYSQPTQQLPMMIVQQPNSGKWGAGKITTFVVIGFVVLIAATVVLSGILYVWASSLEDGNKGSIEGTWYNPLDTMTFYSNGTVAESTGLITHWQIVNGDLVTTFLIEDEEIDMKWKYAIVSDSEGDAVLFLAMYEFENGAQTNVIDETTCIAYSDSVLSAEHQYFDDRIAIFPDWCNPVDD